MASNDCGMQKRGEWHGSKDETLDGEGAEEAVFIKFYWDVKFADCLLSKREGS